MHILLVEDNPAVREPLVDALSTAGLTVTSARSAAEAIAKLEGDEFDVLVTDIHLDTQSAGLEVARHWRAKSPDRPLIFATAYPRAAVNVGPLGARDAYLLKPYGPRELLQVLDFATRNKLGNAQAEPPG